MVDMKFLRFLYEHRKYLTKQELKTMRGQALNGDLKGAIKGVNKLLNKRGFKYE